MTPAFPRRSARPRRKTRRKSAARPIWIIAGTLGVIGLIFCVLYAVKYVDRLSKPHPLPGYVESAAVLQDEYRKYYANILDPAGESCQLFATADERMLHKDFVPAATALERLSREVAVPAVFNDLGLLYARMKDDRHAVAAFRELLARDPAYPPMQRNAKALGAILAEAKAPVTAETEPNDSKDLANSIPMGLQIAAEISTATDVDSFRLVSAAAPRDILEIQVENASTTLAIGVRMFDADLRPIDAGRVTGRAGSSVSVRTSVPPNSVFYLQISGDRGSTGRYVLRVLPTRSYDIYEPNDMISMATRLTIGRASDAGIMDSSDADYYVVESAGAGFLTVDIPKHAQSLAPAVMIFGPDRQRIALDSTDRKPTDGLRYKFPVQGRQQYYIEVLARGDTKGDYSIIVE
jgi:hypothetical protein